MLGLATGLLGLFIPLHDSAIAPFLLVGAAVCGLVGGWVLVVPTVRWLRAARRRFEEKRDYTYKEHGPDLSYLDELVSAGRQEIGEAHPDEALVHQRLRENPKVLKVFTKVESDGRTRFCGYLLIYPLKSDVGKEILKGQVRSEAELKDGSLCKSFDEASYLYVGMVLGTNSHSKAFVKEMLRRELIEIFKSADIEKVFARPGTGRGRKLMESYEFVPIGPDDRGVWSVNGNRLKNRLLAETSIANAIVFDQEGQPVEERSPGL